MKKRAITQKGMCYYPPALTTYRTAGEELRASQESLEKAVPQGWPGLAL